MVMPMCSTASEMFEEQPWNLTSYSETCYKKWGVRPVANLVLGEYGGAQVSTYSNVVFSNGLLDPWSAGGVISVSVEPRSRRLRRSIKLVPADHFWHNSGTNRLRSNDCKSSTCSRHRVYFRKVSGINGIDNTLPKSQLTGPKPIFRRTREVRNGGDVVSASPKSVGVLGSSKVLDHVMESHLFQSGHNALGYLPADLPDTFIINGYPWLVLIGFTHGRTAFGTTKSTTSTMVTWMCRRAIEIMRPDSSRNGLWGITVNVGSSGVRPFTKLIMRTATRTLRIWLTISGNRTAHETRSVPRAFTTSSSSRPSNRARLYRIAAYSGHTNSLGGSERCRLHPPTSVASGCTRFWCIAGANVRRRRQQIDVRSMHSLITAAHTGRTKYHRRRVSRETRRLPSVAPLVATTRSLRSTALSGSSFSPYVVVLIPGAAHHVDLRSAHPNDTIAVKHARTIHRSEIRKWLNSYYAK